MSNIRSIRCNMHSVLAAFAAAVLLGACSQPTAGVPDGAVGYAAVDSGPPETIASGLANPRGIAVTPDGALLVAEAGVGGEGPCFDGPEGDEVCFGTSGAVTKIDRDGQHRIVDGLPSLAAEGGVFATGPHHLSLLGNGQLYLTTGLGADPALRDAFLPDSGLGMLWRVNQARGTVSAAADLAAFELAENPDGAHPDSNPYGLVAVPGGQVVVDAGGNSLLRVSASGRIETLAVFEPGSALAPPFLGLPPGTMIDMEAVPTSVAVGPDGAHYVGLLTGFPFPVGEASVMRVVPGEAPTVFATGFTNIIDVAFDRTGALYVLEFATNGLLSDPPDLRGALHRVQDGMTTTVLGADDGLVAPGGLAFGKDGELYVTNLSVFPGGTVLVLRP
jgi:hypothetical protein